MYQGFAYKDQVKIGDIIAGKPRKAALRMRGGPENIVEFFDKKAERAEIRMSLLLGENRRRKSGGNISREGSVDSRGSPRKTTNERSPESGVGQRKGQSQNRTQTGAMSKKGAGKRPGDRNNITGGRAKMTRAKMAAAARTAGFRGKSPDHFGASPRCEDSEFLDEARRRLQILKVGDSMQTRDVAAGLHEKTGIKVSHLRGITRDSAPVKPSEGMFVAVEQQPRFNTSTSGASHVYKLKFCTEDEYKSNLAIRDQEAVEAARVLRLEEKRIEAQKQAIRDEEQRLRDEAEEADRALEEALKEAEKHHGPSNMAGPLSRLDSEDKQENNRFGRKVQMGGRTDYKYDRGADVKAKYAKRKSFSLADMSVRNADKKVAYGDEDPANDFYIDSRGYKRRSKKKIDKPPEVYKKRYDEDGEFVYVDEDGDVVVDESGNAIIDEKIIWELVHQVLYERDEEEDEFVCGEDGVAIHVTMIPDEELADSVIENVDKAGWANNPETFTASGNFLKLSEILRTNLKKSLNLRDEDGRRLSTEGFLNTLWNDAEDPELASRLVGSHGISLSSQIRSLKKTLNIEGSITDEEVQQEKRKTLLKQRITQRLTVGATDIEQEMKQVAMELMVEDVQGLQDILKDVKHFDGEITKKKETLTVAPMVAPGEETFTYEERWWRQSMIDLERRDSTIEIDFESENMAAEAKETRLEKTLKDRLPRKSVAERLGMGEKTKPDTDYLDFMLHEKPGGSPQENRVGKEQSRGSSDADGHERSRGSVDTDDTSRDRPRNIVTIALEADEREPEDEDAHDEEEPEGQDDLAKNKHDPSKKKGDCDPSKKKGGSDPSKITPKETQNDDQSKSTLNETQNDDIQTYLSYIHDGLDLNAESILLAFGIEPSLKEPANANNGAAKALEDAEKMEEAFMGSPKKDTAAKTATLDSPKSRGSDKGGSFGPSKSEPNVASTSFGASKSDPNVAGGERFAAVEPEGIEFEADALSEFRAKGTRMTIGVAAVGKEERNHQGITAKGEAFDKADTFTEMTSHERKKVVSMRVGHRSEAESTRGVLSRKSSPKPVKELKPYVADGDDADARIKKSQEAAARASAKGKRLSIEMETDDVFGRIKSHKSGSPRGSFSHSPSVPGEFVSMGSGAGSGVAGKVSPTGSMKGGRIKAYMSSLGVNSREVNSGELMDEHENPEPRVTLRQEFGELTLQPSSGKQQVRMLEFAERIEIHLSDDEEEADELNEVDLLFDANQSGSGFQNTGVYQLIGDAGVSGQFASGSAFRSTGSGPSLKGARIVPMKTECQRLHEQYAGWLEDVTTMERDAFHLAQEWRRKRGLNTTITKNRIMAQKVTLRKPFKTDEEVDLVVEEGVDGAEVNGLVKGAGEGDAVGYEKTVASNEPEITLTQAELDMENETPETRSFMEMMEQESAVFLPNSIARRYISDLDIRLRPSDEDYSLVQLKNDIFKGETELIRNKRMFLELMAPKNEVLLRFNSMLKDSGNSAIQKKKTLSLEDKLTKGYQEGEKISKRKFKKPKAERGDSQNSSTYQSMRKSARQARGELEAGGRGRKNMQSIRKSARNTFIARRFLNTTSKKSKIGRIYSAFDLDAILKTPNEDSDDDCEKDESSSGSESDEEARFSGEAWEFKQIEKQLDSTISRIYRDHSLKESQYWQEKFHYIHLDEALKVHNWRHQMLFGALPGVPGVFVSQDKVRGYYKDGNPVKIHSMYIDPGTIANSLDGLGMGKLPKNAPMSWNPFGSSNASEEGQDAADSEDTNKTPAQREALRKQRELWGAGSTVSVERRMDKLQLLYDQLVINGAGSEFFSHEVMSEIIDEVILPALEMLKNVGLENLILNNVLLECTRMKSMRKENRWDATRTAQMEPLIARDTQRSALVHAIRNVIGVPIGDAASSPRGSPEVPFGEEKNKHDQAMDVRGAWQRSEGTKVYQVAYMAARERILKASKRIHAMRRTRSDGCFMPLLKLKFESKEAPRGSLPESVRGLTTLTPSGFGDIPPSIPRWRETWPGTQMMLPADDGSPGRPGSDGKYPGSPGRPGEKEKFARQQTAFARPDQGMAIDDDEKNGSGSPGSPKSSDRQSNQSGSMRQQFVRRRKDSLEMSDPLTGILPPTGSLPDFRSGSDADLHSRTTRIPIAPPSRQTRSSVGLNLGPKSSRILSRVKSLGLIDENQDEETVENIMGSQAFGQNSISFKSCSESKSNCREETGKEHGSISQSRAGAAGAKKLPKQLLLGGLSRKDEQLKKLMKIGEVSIMDQWADRAIKLTKRELEKEIVRREGDKRIEEDKAKASQAANVFSLANKVHPVSAIVDKLTNKAQMSSPLKQARKNVLPVQAGAFLTELLNPTAEGTGGESRRSTKVKGMNKLRRKTSTKAIDIWQTDRDEPEEEHRRSPANKLLQKVDNTVVRRGVEQVDDERRAEAHVFSQVLRGPNLLFPDVLAIPDDRVMVKTLLGEAEVRDVVLEDTDLDTIRQEIASDGGILSQTVMDNMRGSQSTSHVVHTAALTEEEEAEANKKRREELKLKTLRDVIDRIEVREAEQLEKQKNILLDAAHPVALEAEDEIGKVVFAKLFGIPYEELLKSETVATKRAVDGYEEDIEIDARALRKWHPQKNTLNDTTIIKIPKTKPKPPWVANVMQDFGGRLRAALLLANEKLAMTKKRSSSAPPDMRYSPEFEKRARRSEQPTQNRLMEDLRHISKKKRNEDARLMVTLGEESGYRRHHMGKYYDEGTMKDRHGLNPFYYRPDAWYNDDKKLDMKEQVLQALQDLDVLDDYGVIPRNATTLKNLSDSNTLNTTNTLLKELKILPILQKYRKFLLKKDFRLPGFYDGYEAPKEFKDQAQARKERMSRVPTTPKLLALPGQKMHKKGWQNAGQNRKNGLFGGAN